MIGQLLFYSANNSFLKGYTEILALLTVCTSSIAEQHCTLE